MGVVLLQIASRPLLADLVLAGPLFRFRVDGTSVYRRSNLNVTGFKKRAETPLLKKEEDGWKSRVQWKLIERAVQKGTKETRCINNSMTRNLPNLPGKDGKLKEEHLGPVAFHLGKLCTVCSTTLCILWIGFK